MKNRKGLTILTSLVAALFILSLFAGIAMAQNQTEQYEKAKEQYQQHKERYEETKKKFEDAKDQFEKASKQFKDAKDKKSKDELALKTREYIERTTDQAISSLEVLKSRVELPENKGIIPFDASKNIDARIAQLEQIRTRVQQANTTQEFRDAHKELKDLWVKIRLETRYDFEIVLKNKIDTFITKGDNVSARLDAAIQKATAQGKDASELKKDAANYNELLKKARDSQQATAGLFTSHAGFADNGTVTNNKDAEAFVLQVDKSQRETLKDLRAASKKVLDFVKDFRKHSGGKARVSEKGELEAEGTATATTNVTVTATPTVTTTATPAGNTSANSS
ncbi:MAG: hypothetical protein PHU34_06010 [Candidatus Methanoperedens sp.]|nr:hypothetical protein [Candidatus Methanoperedens sp.]